MSTARALSSEAVKALLPDSLVFRGNVNGDLDNIKASGYYNVAPAYTANFPAGAYQYAILVCFATNDRRSQLYMSVGSDGSLFARGWAAGAWGPWHKIGVGGGGGGKKLHFFPKRAERRAAA